MNLEQDKLDLIEKVIKNDRKFSNNEDLYDDFFNETCKRSLGIINIISTDTALEGYLRKIASTSILNVLKDSGRLKRTKSGYTPVKESPLENNITNNFASAEISYKFFDVVETPEEHVVRKDTLNQIKKIVLNANNLRSYYIIILTYIIIYIAR